MTVKLSLNIAKPKAAIDGTARGEGEQKPLSALGIIRCNRSALTNPRKPCFHFGNARFNIADG